MNPHERRHKNGKLPPGSTSQRSKKIAKQSREKVKSMNGTIEVGDNLDLLALHASDFMLCSLSTIINRENERRSKRELKNAKLPCANHECKSLTLCFSMRF